MSTPFTFHMRRLRTLDHPVYGIGYRLSDALAQMHHVPFQNLSRLIEFIRAGDEDAQVFRTKESKGTPYFVNKAALHVLDAHENKLRQEVKLFKQETRVAPLATTPQVAIDSATQDVITRLEALKEMHLSKALELEGVIEKLKEN